MVSRFAKLAMFLLGGALLVPAGAVPADAAAPNFKGETLTVIISSRPGDGTDAMVRLLGRMMTKYLPGNPDMLYKNMPAGSGIQGINYFVEKVKPDGRTWLGGSGSSLRPDRVRRKAVRYDPRKLRMFGGLPAPGGLFVVRKDAMPRLYDKSKTPIVFGGIDGSRSSNQMGIWGPEYLGWNLRWVVGYKGTSEMTLAFERGETQAYVTYNAFILDPMKTSGQYEFVAQVGFPKGDKFVKRADYPDVPVISHQIKPKLSGIALKAFEAWELIVQGGKWYALHPGASDEMLKVYGDAHEKAVKEPDYIANAKKIWSTVYETSNADETQQLANKLMEISPEALEFIEGLKRKVGVPSIKVKKKRK